METIELERYKDKINYLLNGGNGHGAYLTLKLNKEIPSTIRSVTIGNPGTGFEVGDYLVYDASTSSTEILVTSVDENRSHRNSLS